MLAYDISLYIQKITGNVVFSGQTFHEGNVVPVGNKADILTVVLFGIYKILLQCDGTGFRFA